MIVRCTARVAQGLKLGRLGDTPQARDDWYVNTVTVEEIVDTLAPHSPNAVILPGWTVSAVVHVAGGAHPSYAQGYYKRDNAFYKRWDAISRERDSFRAWIDEHVLKKGPDAFAVHANKAA